MLLYWADNAKDAVSSDSDGADGGEDETAGRRDGGGRRVHLAAAGQCLAGHAGRAGGVRR